MDMIKTIEKAFEEEAKEKVLETLRSKETVEELESEGSEMVETSSRKKCSRLARVYEKEQEKSMVIADRAEYTRWKEERLVENCRPREKRTAKVERTELLNTLREEMTQEEKRNAEMIEKMEDRTIKEMERIAEIRAKRNREAMEKTAEIRRKRKMVVMEEAEDEEIGDEEVVEGQPATEHDEEVEEDWDWEIESESDQ
jgi:hypothetical protein